MSLSGRSADSAERAPIIVLTPKLVQVQRADWWVSALLVVCYLCLAIANSQLCQKIAADHTYRVIQKIRLVGLHVFAAILSLLMMFVETKITICQHFMRALTRHLLVRIFVATAIIAMTISERNLRLLSFSVGSVITLGVLLFVQVLVRCICFAEYEVLLQEGASESLALTHAAQYGAVRTRPDLSRTAQGKRPGSNDGSVNSANSRSTTPRSKSLSQQDPPPSGDLPSWAIEPRSLYTIEAVEFSDDEEMPFTTQQYFQNSSRQEDDGLPAWARD